MPGLGRYFDHIIKKKNRLRYGDAVAGEVQATRDLRNWQRRRFAKSARHHAGLESRLELENQADCTESPPQQTAKEPNKKYSDTESS